MWEPWKINTEKSNNHRMMEQLVFHKQPKVKDISVQDLDPSPFGSIDHTSVLAYEMTVIEPGDTPSRTLTWKPFTSSVEPMTTVFPPLNGSRFYTPVWVFPLTFPP